MSKIVCYPVPSYESDALQAAVERIFDACACTKPLSSDTRLLIKPNLLAKHAPGAAVTTNPALVRAVIVAAKKRGVQHIVLADSPGGVYNEAIVRSIYAASGLAAVCEEEGAELYTACKWHAKKASGALVHEWNWIEPVHSADFIINLPKLKTHMMMGMSGAVKNLFGCIPGLQKAELHMRFPDAAHFGNMLVDLYEAVRPQLTIVDGVTGMEGDGPAGGVPRHVGYVLGGEDGYAIDLAICHIIGMQPMSVPFLAAANARGLCKAAFDSVDIDNAEANACVPIADFALPSGRNGVDFSSNVPRFLRPLVKYAQRAAAPRPVIRRAKCIGCGKCADICPQNTILLANKKAKILPKRCIKCFCCHEVCPVKAIGVRTVFQRKKAGKLCDR